MLAHKFCKNLGNEAKLADFASLEAQIVSEKVCFVINLKHSWVDQVEILIRSVPQLVLI